MFKKNKHYRRDLFRIETLLLNRPENLYHERLEGNYLDIRNTKKKSVSHKTNVQKY